MITAPSHSRFNDSGKVVPAILIVLALGIGIFFGRPIGERMVGFIGKLVEVGQSLQGYPDKAWSSRTAGEITLDAPFAFAPGPDIRKDLPPEVQKVLLHHDLFVSEKSARFVQVNVARIEYAADIQPSLDGAAEGANKQVAAKMGDSLPKFNISTTVIDGLPARSTSYHGRTDKGSIYVDGVFAQKGQVIWQVSVVYKTEIHQSIAQRLLDSVHIKPAR